MYGGRVAEDRQFKVMGEVVDTTNTVATVHTYLCKLTALNVAGHANDGSSSRFDHTPQSQDAQKFD